MKEDMRTCPSSEQSCFRHYNRVKLLCPYPALLQEQKGDLPYSAMRRKWEHIPRIVLLQNAEVAGASKLRNMLLLGLMASIWGHFTHAESKISGIGTKMR